MPPVNLHQSIRDILLHGVPLPAGADCPIRHFELTAGDIEGTLDYFRKKIDSTPSSPVISERHLGRLRQMALVSLIETLERLLKELAAVCVDVLAPVTADDRLDAFRVNGSAIAGHFGTDTLGRALCETGTWLDCKTVNDRFRELLADPSPGPQPLPPFQLFRQQPADERGRYDTLQLVWQLRHTLVHNVGVVTPSDAVKLRVLSKRAIDPPRIVVPTRDDVRHLHRFLKESAERCNRRIAERVAEILSRIHAENPILFDPSERATYLAAQFRETVTIAGATVAPPP